MENIFFFGFMVVDIIGLSFYELRLKIHPFNQKDELFIYPRSKNL